MVTWMASAFVEPNWYNSAAVSWLTAASGPALSNADQIKAGRVGSPVKAA
jgi:hypothetical protein